MHLRDSPGVVKFLGAERDERRIFLERLDGGSLLDLATAIKGFVVDEAEGRRITRELFEAVTDMHRRGVGHNDIKVSTTSMPSLLNLLPPPPPTPHSLSLSPST